MALCAASCTQLPPRPIGEGCGVTTRPGGISRLVFAACSVQFTDINDRAEWCRYVSEGKIVVSPPGVGKKDKGSATKKRISSCGSEQVIGYERTIAFVDNGGDNVNFTDYTFWSRILENPSLFQFGWLTCDGLFTGFITDFAIEVDNVIEETNLGNSFWDAMIMFQGFLPPRPYNIPGLLTILQGDCSAVPNFDPCETGIITSNGTVLCSLDPLLLTATYYIGASYQWEYDLGAGFVNIPSANGNTYLANEATPAQSVDYRVTINRPGCPAVVVVGPTVTSNRPDIVSVGVVLGTVTITPGAGTYIYRLVINGPGGAVPTVWQNSNVFTFVPSGDHFAQIQSTSGTTLGCQNEEAFTVV